MSARIPRAISSVAHLAPRAWQESTGDKTCMHGFTVLVMVTCPKLPTGLTSDLNSTMATSSSPDWSAASISSCRKPELRNITCTSTTCKTLHFLSLPCSKVSPFHANSSSCPSPMLEEFSTKFPVIQLDVRIQDPEQLPIPEEAEEDLNGFLCGVLQDPQTQDLACEYYRKAVEQRPDFRPEKSMLKLLIRYLIRSKNWGFILSVSNDFSKYSVFPDSHTCSRLISSCIRARKFKIVETLLEIFKSADSEIALSAFDAAMRGYKRLHMHSTTVSVYEKMKSTGIPLDSRCYCQIMIAYQKIGDAERVAALFHEFKSKNLVSKPRVLSLVYITLCEALGKSGRAFEALEYFRDMTRKGILQYPSTYSTLICAFARIREVSVAEQLFKEAEEKKMLRDPETFLNLVLMYVEEGLVEKTLGIVKAMKRANRRLSDCIFCAIVNGFSKRRGFVAAVRVYEELRTSEGCEPGQVTYASIINAYCRIGLHSKAELVFQEMEQKGFDKCVVAYSSMVAMYGKTGRLKDAMRLVAKMKVKGCEPNVWIYNSLLDMHGRAKNLRQVEKIWKEMKRRKVAPDKVTYTSVISAYHKAKELEMCVRFYQEYRSNGGVIDKALAGIMVGVLSKINRIDELLKLLRDMKSEGTPVDWRLYRSALNALRDAGLEMQAKWLQESFQAT